MAVGRISGPLLKSNLLRDGIDLAFENDLLYLDVNNLRVGINTSTPTHDLTVAGTTRTVYLEATNQLDIGPITITGNTISTTSPALYLNPLTNNIVYQASLTVDSINIDTNVISANTPDTDIELHTSGTGSVKIYADTRVEGNIHATGNISADGDIQIGDANTDSITFNAEVNSDIVPNIDNTYDLGSSTNRWRSVWTKNFIASNVSTGEIIVDGIDLKLAQGNIIYVAENGNNDNTGTHQNDPYQTIEFALLNAVAGDTVYVYPGVYQEDTPLTVPVGVTIKGADIRNTIVEPVSSDPAKDVFLLNGESTVEDITIRGHLYDAINNVGHAFRFAPGFKVTTRSPYIRNVTVLSTGSVTSTSDPRGYDTGDAGRGAYIDGAVADPTTNEASMLFHSVTFLCPGVDAITMTNGARVEWLNCFTYWATKGLYGISGSSGIAGQGRTRLKVQGLTGSYSNGQTISYYAEDGVTVLASGTIADTTGGYIYINGKASGFLEFNERVGKLVTASGSVQISTAQSKFGGASGQFVTATNDEINVAANDDLAFGTGDFTIEFWIYFVASAATQSIFDMRTSAIAQAALLLEVSSSGFVKLYVQGAFQITAAAPLSDNTWHHIAISRVSGVTRMFINGTVEATTYTDANNYTAKPLNIGAYYNSTAHLNAYIDDFRVSKGIGRYTGSFSVPTAAYGSDSNTVLLLHFNGTNGSTTFEDDSNLVQDIQFSGGATATQITLADYTDFGCEVRSIGSAAVYGDYGIYGDGEGVVMYLIGQNLAYIGLGKRSDNDPLAVVQANEVVELNDAQIYYTSVDHKGDFRVGDLFYVNQDTGTVQFSNTIVNISGATGFTFTDGSNTTIINPTKVETGNIRISGNTIESLTGDVNIISASDIINLQNNVNITGNLDVTGNVTIGGNITIGDQTTDSVQFVAGIDSDIIPNLPATYNIGSNVLQWKDLWVRTAHISDIEISTNYIRTTVSNTDLELRANGTGSILVEDIRVNQNVISTDSGNIQITPATTLDITASTTNVNGDLHITNNVSIDGDITLGNANTDNVVFNARVNSNIIPSISNIYDLGTPAKTWANTWLASAYIDDIYIDTNIIQTVVSNSNLELRANGTGSVVLEQTYINENLIYTVGNNLTIQPATTLDIIATSTNITGDLTVTGTTSFDSDVTFGDNFTDNVVFNARVNSNIIPAISNVYDLGSSTKSWANTWLASAYIDDIYIDTNIIQTVVSNSNLELRANGTGSVQLEQTYINENLIYTVGTNLQIQPATTLDITASTTNINGDLHVTGNVDIDGNIVLGTDNTDTVVYNSRVNSDIVPTISGIYNLGAPSKAWGTTYLSKVYIDDILIDTNIIQTTASNSNLELRANGTGSVQLEQTYVNENLIYTVGTNLLIQPATTLDITASTTNVNGDLHVTGNTSVDGNVVLGTDITDSVEFISRVNSDIVPTISGIYNLGAPNKAWGTSYLSQVYIDDILIDTNIIQTTASNSNLELRANGTGSVQLEQTYVNENLIYTVGTNLLIQPATTLDITASTTNVNGDLHVTGNVDIDANTTLGSDTTDSVTFNSRVISDIVPNISGIYNLGIPGKAWNISYLSSAYIDDIYIDTNIIQTTISNSNLELRANGTGVIRVEKIDIYDNIIQTNGTDNLEIRPATTLDIFADTNINGDLNVTGNVTIGGNITVGNQDTDNITFVADVNSNLIPNLPVTYNLGSALKRWNTLFSATAQISDIEINTNVIRTTVSNADLELRANGTGTIKFEDFTVDTNVISVPSGTNMILQPAGTGIVDINSTQALRLPRGTTIQQPGTPQAGMIRYNTTNNNYEGYDGTYWRVLNGVYDVDQNTYLVAESTPGANDNTFYFYANNTQIADLNSTRLNAIRVEVDDLVIDGNTISSVNNQNINITSSGTGKVKIENFEIKDNTLTNTVSGSVTTISQTGTGYFKIDGTTGFVIPVGAGSQRPSGTPETGFTRFNTDDQRIEVYNGTTWQSAAGSSSGVTVVEAEEIAILQVLMLG